MILTPYGQPSTKTPATQNCYDKANVPIRVILTFQIEPLSPEQPEVLSVTPMLSGVPLTQLVQEFETLQMFNPAGGYAGLVPGNYRFGPLNCHFLADTLAIDHDADWKVTDRYLLGCTCGEVGCWPITADINRTGELITWNNFRQPHRPDRVYSAFGPFHFNFEQYHAVVNAVDAQFLEG